MKPRIFVLFALAIAACGGTSVIDGGSGASSSSSSASSSSASGANSSSSSTSGGGGAGLVQCNPNDALCNTIPPTCPPGEVPSVEASCWGDCVPILSCATEPNCDNCQTGFCAEYVSFTTEYRCVLPSLMCSALACSCLAEYFCADPFDVCTDAPAQGDVSCECTTC